MMVPGGHQNAGTMTGTQCSLKTLKRKKKLKWRDSTEAALRCFVRKNTEDVQIATDHQNVFRYCKRD